MNKTSILIAALAASVALTGCEIDKEPVYTAPTEFVLDQPAMADETIQLAPGQTLEFTCSQPDYGYSAVTQYSLEMALDKDFTSPLPLTPARPTSPVISISQADLATAMCELHGFTSEDNYQELPPEPVYFRATAQIGGIESSLITSNVVSLNQVKMYFAVKVPGSIYLIGACSGWKEPAEANKADLADWRLYEAKSQIGSKIYSGIFDVPAGQAAFRFYTALTGWGGGDSYGSPIDGKLDPDKEATVDYPDAFATEAPFESAIGKAKANFSFPGWEGGKMSTQVDLSKPEAATITIYKGEHPFIPVNYIYMVGDPTAWAVDSPDAETIYKDFRLADMTESNIYSGIFDMKPGQNFRFYTQLGDWGAYSLGSQEADASVSVSLTAGVYTGPYVEGKGNWSISNCPEGPMQITVDMNNKTVEFRPVEAE